MIANKPLISPGFQIPSGQILIFHQHGFPWNNGSSLSSATFFGLKPVVFEVGYNLRPSNLGRLGFSTNPPGSSSEAELSQWLGMARRKVRPWAVGNGWSSRMISPGMTMVENDNNNNNNNKNKNIKKNKKNNKKNNSNKSSNSNNNNNNNNNNNRSNNSQWIMPLKTSFISLHNSTIVIQLEVGTTTERTARGDKKIDEKNLEAWDPSWEKYATLMPYPGYIRLGRPQKKTSFQPRHPCL